jgi:lipoyl(octanoyl) transferase
MLVFDLGCIGYQQAFDVQLHTQTFVQDGGDDVLLLLEHTPTVSLGKNFGMEHLPPDLQALWGKPVDVEHSTRGGNITCHFPGQLVAYPIMNLKKRNNGVRQYVHDLEEAIIRALRHFGVEAARKPGFPGVWVEGAKIASLGIAVRRSITMHGMALNVEKDLSLFNIIAPCGLEGVAATSVQRVQQGPPASMQAVKDAFLQEFHNIFCVPAVPVPPMGARRDCFNLLHYQESMLP